jgi:serine/threonine protein kinase
MAPEQARGQAIDERSDLFALGVILWELVTRQPLFERESEGQTILALIDADVSRPSSLRDGVAPAWDDFILRAVEYDPKKRFPSAVAMSAALAALPTARDSGGEDLRVLVARLLEIPEREPAAVFDVDRSAAP